MLGGAERKRDKEMERDVMCMTLHVCECVLISVILKRGKQVV